VVNLGEARDIINAFTDLERQLASPEGDTRSSEPSRPVPPRRPSLSAFPFQAQVNDGF
jgi:hypothetical protein